jgi:RNA polymerase sigma factor (sigma-70 family)
MSALLQATANELEPDAVATDHKLVAAVRRGDDRAFESLYERYNRRIHAYVFGMVKDHQRAEDVTQEVFVSALRRMRATERPIAFKPWIYEIAKNACIDQFRRSKRAEEVSYDADDGLAPGDYGRLVSREPVPDAALAAKQQLDHLCGAFGGLSEAHHQILVLRELEGLSYREIGERMGMSRPAVESTLFRARRRLSEEYDELASGQRCLRIQSIIATAGSGRLGARDTRKLARHVAHCQPCRRQALAAGVDSALVARRPLRERAIEKVAALFPFPLLLRGRRDGGGGSGDGWMSQLPVVSDHAAAGGAKLAAVAALVIAGLGAGVGTQVVPGKPSFDGASGARPAKSVVKPSKPAASRVPARVAPARSHAAASGQHRSGTRSTLSHGASRSLGTSGGRPTTGSPRSGSGGSGGVTTGTNVPASVPDTGAAPRTPATGGGSAGGTAPSITIQLPAVDPNTSAPASTIDTGPAVQQVTDTVTQTTQGVTGAVQGAAGAVDQTTSGALGGLGG